MNKLILLAILFFLLLWHENERKEKNKSIQELKEFARLNGKMTYKKALLLWAEETEVYFPEKHLQKIDSIYYATCKTCYHE